MRLVGIQLQDFRSIGTDGVLLRPMRKCNVLVGQNNAGKSNVLRAIQAASSLVRAMSTARNGNRDPKVPQPFTTQDSYRRAGKPFRLTLTFLLESEGKLDDLLRTVVREPEISFHLEALPEQGARIVSSTFHDLAREHRDARQANKEFIVQNDFLKKVGGNHYSRPVSAVEMNKLLGETGEKLFRSELAQMFPPVEIIPEFRQIQTGNGYAFDGTSLVAELAKFQHPPEGQDHLRKKFDSIEQFVRVLLHLPDARLEVSHGNDEVLLTSNGLRLALPLYGTGVHQLVILLTAVLTMNPHSICCMEEPEIHLHPRLQREFLRFLTRETEHVYFLSSHSASFINAHVGIDAEESLDVQIHHVRMTPNSGSTSNAVLGDDEPLEALNDLGLRASDLLQANCVIWVEGPSDRIYIYHWLQLLGPTLKEGLHYSIMFYGGSLLAHVELSRNAALNELVPLLRINQNAAVVIDSDKTAPGQRINKTKQRVQTALKANRPAGYCWITDGRELENYLPAGVLETFASKTVGVDTTINFGKYDRLEQVLGDATKGPRSNRLKVNYANDKVRYAKQLCKHFDKSSIASDLRSHLCGLKRFIDQCNGIETTVDPN